MLRDSCGKVVLGFSEEVRACLINMDEVKAIDIRIKLLVARGFVDVLVEFDSSFVINIIQNRRMSKHACAQLVQSIHHLAGNSIVRSWAHVLREANQVADFFANYGLSPNDLLVFDSLPTLVYLELMTDVCNASFLRGF